MVFYITNSDFSTRIAKLYGPRPHLRFLAFKTATLAPELQVSMGPRLRLLVCECKTARLAPKVLVSKGPSPHLWFLHEK